MATYILTDVAQGIWVDEFQGKGVRKKTLRGGKCDGIDLIEIDNGALKLALLPTRGMGLWSASCAGDRIGWDSPITDGPVHPRLVNLAGAGGIGWLDGFDEMMVRCGLENNGAPYHEGNAIVGLHGKIANIPAHSVTVETDRGIVVRGVVDETRLFGPQLRLSAEVEMLPDTNQITVSDTFTNLSDAPTTMQVLYHWNFGPPHLEAGSSFVAPVAMVAPRDATAVPGIDDYSSYFGPVVGQPERVYFFKLIADESGRTLVMLRNAAGDKAVVLRFDVSQLPCFTLWKNEGGLKSGYVTGLEPGTNFPNPKPFEQSKGRVITLEAGASHVAVTTLEILNTSEQVRSVQAEVAMIQARHVPLIHRTPQSDLSAKEI